jgi:hypothetical protein
MRFKKTKEQRDDEFIGRAQQLEKLMNPKWMAEQLISKTALVIANEIGVSVSVLNRWKWYLGLKLPSRKLVLALRAAYKDGVDWDTFLATAKEIWKDQIPPDKC